VCTTGHARYLLRKYRGIKAPKYKHDRILIQWKKFRPCGQEFGPGILRPIDQNTKQLHILMQLMCWRTFCDRRCVICSLCKHELWNGLIMNSISAAVLGILGLWALTGCSVTSESSVTSAAPCDPAAFNASQCSHTTQNRTKSITLFYGEDSLRNAGPVEDGRLYIAPGDKSLSEFTYSTGGQQAEIQLVLDIEYTEVQRRSQKWRPCGFLGAERCRQWEDHGREYVELNAYIEVNGNREFSPQYDTRQLDAGDWSEDSNSFRTIFGPLASLGSGDIYGGFVDTFNSMLSGRELHDAVRTFTGSSKATILVRIPPNQLSHIKIGTKSTGTGVAKVAPYKVEIQTFE
jgi:hypothetical protein